MRVGIFDSGIGGLTILKSFLENHPNNEYIYYGDSKNMPYGEKTKEELLEISRRIIDFLISKKVEAIIIACGTLSSTCYEELKKEFNVPIYDIISPIIEAVKESNIKRVLLLGTEKTINAREFEYRLVENKIHVEKCACPKFAPIIEGKIKDDLNIAIQEYLYDFKGMNIDVIIPACTHYPIIGDEISEYMDVTMLDIGLVISKKIKIDYGISGLEVYFSQIDKDTEKIIKAIIGDCEIKEKELS